jgi:hypothetical protein
VQYITGYLHDSHIQAEAYTEVDVVKDREFKSKRNYLRHSHLYPGSTVLVQSLSSRYEILT